MAARTGPRMCVWSSILSNWIQSAFGTRHTNRKYCVQQTAFHVYVCRIQTKKTVWGTMLLLLAAFDTCRELTIMVWYVGGKRGRRCLRPVPAFSAGTRHLLSPASRRFMTRCSDIKQSSNDSTRSGQYYCVSFGRLCWVSLTLISRHACSRSIQSWWRI